MKEDRESSIDGRHFHIEPFSQADLDEMMEIENVAFTLPWTRDSYEELIPLDSIAVSVAKLDQEVAGYILTQHIGEEMELHSFAVKPSLRNKGIGRRLLDFMISNAKAKGVSFIFLQVRPSNGEALSLYRKMGFVSVGTRRGYYHDNNEDAIIMKLELSSRESVVG